MESAIKAARQRMDEIFKHMLLQTNVPKESIEEAMEEFSTLLEELSTANEEIQANTESLVQAQMQLEKEQQKYQEMFFYAPDAYIETDIAGKILQANEAASSLYNLSVHFLIGKPLSVYVSHEDRKKFYDLLRPARRINDAELTMQPRGRTPFTASISLVPVKDREGKSFAIRWLIRDITVHKEEQAALGASEERFRTIFTHSHVGMLLTDLDGRVVESNVAFERMIGYIHEELLGLSIDGLIEPKDREDSNLARIDLLEQNKSSRTIETRFLTKNEQEIWTRQTISVLPDKGGEPVYFIHLIENITQQKQSNEELSEMKRRMIESVESERLHLAQELHDGPIQDLYGAVFKLNDLPTNGDANKDNIKETQDLIKQVAGTLRGICGDLRPPTLSNFGLDRAIQTHMEQVQDQNKTMTITLQADRDNHILTQQVRMGLFRIYQQCIMNVIRHSRAAHVTVRLEIGAEEVSLMVEDDGVGFEPPTRMVDLLRTGHYGLAGISERVESMNGSLIIDASPGKGTRVTVEIPRQGVPSEQS